jgi:hypothetical protein
MTIDEYRDEIGRLWPEHGEPPREIVVRLCAQAVADHPRASDLWYTLGIIIQRCGDNYGFTADDYRLCFERSVDCDNANAEAHQELGFVLDVYFNDYRKAAQAFRAAVLAGAGQESYFGYARVLAEQGRTDAAVISLSEGSCPFWNQPDIERLRAEILSGRWCPRPADEHAC